MIYAVNKRTKEYRLVRSLEQESDYAADSGWSLLDADPDGWIEWEGDSECPLPGDVLCDVKFMDGVEVNGEPADEWNWKVLGPGATIIAYRPILDADTKPDPRQEDGEMLPPVGCEVHWVNADADDQTFTVVAHDEDVVICHNPWDTDNRYIWGLWSDFRPIRSEEDSEVEEMVRELADAGCEGFTLKHYARILYRAGYRKTGGEG